PNPEADPMTTPFVSEKQKEVSGPIAPSPKFVDLSESIPAPIKKSEDNPFISRAPFIPDATINLTDQGTRSETSDSLSEKSGWPGPYEEKAKTEIKPQAETIQAPTQKNMALLSDSASIEMENPIDALADAMIYHRTSKQNETLIVRLKPDHLGCVQLHLQQKDEKIIITIRTDNHRTGQLLKHQTEAIESALLARGFSDTQVILQLDENAAIGNGSAGHLPSGYSNGWTSNGEPNRQKQNDWTPSDPRPVEQEKPILIRTRKYALIDKMA
ncbi:MAG: flagellar hook-length control protein FliK, partial [Clostridia bacterium]|nr:flagellar hook-length control protein FliK [Clostridia bacterium]